MKVKSSSYKSDNIGEENPSPFPPSIDPVVCSVDLMYELQYSDYNPATLHLLAHGSRETLNYSKRFFFINPKISELIAIYCHVDAK